MIEFLIQPWPWYVSGAVIAFILAFLLFSGKFFGVSSNLRTICSACGAGKKVKFFDFNWRSQVWNLLFLVGAIIGGFISAEYLASDEGVNISKATIQDLRELNISAPDGLQPEEIYTMEGLDLRIFLVLLIGGFMVGFGSRYAGGCTSGHAISGLSELQVPSLIAVVGFFIGGLFTTFVLLPLIF